MTVAVAELVKKYSAVWNTNVPATFMELAAEISSEA
jgi:hypothetical protein